MAILISRHVTKRFGGLVAVSAFDLEIKERSISSIIGPNGAGKTTFFNCITGFYQAEEGEILFEGRLIQNRPPDQITRLGIARTYQNIRLFANMTAMENILVGLHPRLKSTWVGAVLGAPGTKATFWPRTCLTATSGGWRSPVPWPASPDCCCWMSPRRA
jgi:branched-chain amino acid transport system ATP-binding protein